MEAIGLCVTEKGSGGVEEVAEDGGRFRREGGFGEGVVHHGDPAIAGVFVDFVGIVAHAEAGVAAFFDVSGRAAEAEDEEAAEAVFGAGEVIGGVHGAKDGVLGDLAVEGGDEAAEAVLADGGVYFVFGHFF